MKNIFTSGSLKNLLSKPINDLALEAKQDGSILLGYTCKYVPEPILSVSGLLPVLIKPSAYTNTAIADSYLSSVNCSYCRCLLESAHDFELDELDGYIFTASCDHLRRVFDNLDYSINPPFVHILDLPHKSETQHINWYANKLYSLALKIQSRFSIDMSESAILKATEFYNSYQSLLTEISNLRKHNPTLISGENFHLLLMAGQTSPKQSIIPSIQKCLEDAKPITTKVLPRIMILGSRIEEPEFIATIESTGCHVVADRFCAGSIPGLEKVEYQNDENIFSALARFSYSNTSCPRMMDEFDKRMSIIKTAIKEFSVDAVIVESMKFCDIWGIETVALINELKEMGIPTLKLEREYSTISTGQLETRVQAFLESL